MWFVENAAQFTKLRGRAAAQLRGNVADSAATSIGK